MKRLIAMVLCLVMVLSTVACAPNSNSAAELDSSLLAEMEQLSEEGSYQRYLEGYADAPMAASAIAIGSRDICGGENYRTVPALGGKEIDSVVTESTGFVTFSFTVPETGLYQMELEYYPLEGKGSAIMRNILIDGQLPYDEAREVEFARIWTNATAITQDSRGNDIRPTQVEAPDWQKVFVKDAAGFHAEPLKIYLTEGQHTLTLESVREPMAVAEITLGAAPQSPDYATYLQQHQNPDQTQTFYDLIQGENAVRKSSQVIYPVTDRSSASTSPNSPKNIRLNTLGGEKWQTAGHWVEWTVTVPESGLYKLNYRVRQNIVQGACTTRRLLVNGQVPFKEAETIRVYYDMAWQYLTFADEQGQPYSIWLEEGENTLRLEAHLGDMNQMLRETFACVDTLNEIYRQILMITGPVPDMYRDYRFHKQTPQLLEDLKAISIRLDALYQEYQKETGESGHSATSLYKLAVQTKKMGEDQREIAKNFTVFKSNIVALGDFVVTLRKQPLEVDYLEIATAEHEFTEVKATLWENIGFVIDSFLASFSDNYASMNSEAKDAHTTITVWVGSGAQAGVATAGRDQAQVIKQMAETMFTPEHGIAVDIQLVSTGSLMSAVMSGNAPDVALSLGGSEPVNYAIRNGVVDLTQFEGFEEVSHRFKESALVPLTFDGGVYGLPETQSYYMLFYRKDILEDMGLEVPQTWDDVIAMLPELHKQQLDFGLPVAISDAIGIGFNGYAMFLYQNGGEFYTSDGAESLLDSNVAIDSFYQWTDFYTEYRLAPLYDFASRFRMGDMPIAIADYTLYNQISVFAPELRGEWDFAPVPGTLKEDGTVDRSVAGSVTAGVILADSQEQEAAWEFLKWWTDTDTQVTFGLELESIMGAAARYATANVEALERLPWSQKDIDRLNQQWQWVKGVPEVPGGYYTPRYLDFALRKVYYRAEDPGETLEDMVETINDELTAKREELGLQTRQ